MSSSPYNTFLTTPRPDPRTFDGSGPRCFVLAISMTRFLALITIGFINGKCRLSCDLVFVQSINPPESQNRGRSTHAFRDLSTHFVPSEMPGAWYSRIKQDSPAFNPMLMHELFRRMPQLISPSFLFWVVERPGCH
jgi:hypothetical protein